MADITTRLDEVWAAVLTEEELRARIDEIVAELPIGDPTVPFERAGAWDSTGHPDRAVPLYREALTAGLEGPRRRQATIQLASSLRALGEARESAELLEEELGRASDELDDAVRVFLALALTDAGREREAVALLIRTIAPTLPRYRRSATAYADQLSTLGPPPGQRVPS